MTRGYKLNELENDQLAFDIIKVSRIRSDYHSEDSYQVEN